MTKTNYSIEIIRNHLYWWHSNEFLRVC